MCQDALWVNAYTNALLLFTIKVVLLLMFFACFLVIMVRMRTIIGLLKEIRDKK